MLDRQLRQVPRWLGQNRYNGPSGGVNKPDLPEADVAKHPSISADGRTRRLGRLPRRHLGGRAARGDPRARGACSARAGSRSRRRAGRRPSGRARPTTRSCRADGGAVAFETAESTYPLAKRVGQMTVLVRDLATGQGRRVSHAYRKTGAPTRTAFNPALSADGRIVAFEATDAGRNGAPSRNGAVGRGPQGQARAARHRRLARRGLPARGLRRRPRGGLHLGRARQQRAHARLPDVAARRGRTSLVSRADGRKGAPAAGDAYEPSVSRDGRFVAFTSRAAQPRRRRPRRHLRARPATRARPGS